MLRNITEDVQRRLEGMLLNQANAPVREPKTKHIQIQRYVPSQDIRMWIRAFDQRCDHEGINNGRHRKAELLANLDLGTAYASVTRMNLPDDLSYEEFKAQLTDRFARTTGSLEYREEFRTCFQGKDETVDTYVDRLIGLAERAFPALTDEQREAELVDQFTMGVRISPHAREQLILTRPPGLQAARSIVQRMTMASQLARGQHPVRSLEGDDKDPKSKDDWVKAMLDQQTRILHRQQQTLNAMQQQLQRMQQQQPEQQQPGLQQSQQRQPEEQQAQYSTAWKPKLQRQPPATRPPQAWRDNAPRTTRSAPQCFRCGQSGHIAPACPQQASTVPKPSGNGNSGRARGSAPRSDNRQ